MLRFVFPDTDTQGFVPWFEWNSTAPCEVDTEVVYQWAWTLRADSHSVRSPMIVIDPDLDRSVEHVATYVARQNVPVGPVPVLVDYVMALDWHKDGFDMIWSRFQLGPEWQSVSICFFIPANAEHLSVCVGFDPNPSSNANNHHDAFHVGELRIT